MTNIKVLYNEDNKIINEMKLIDWDFSKEAFISPVEKSPFNNRKHHWYPGTFIPEIPYSLIEILSKKNAVILDPFMGIGTTYFQALLLERQPIGIENCTVAYQFCKEFLYLIKNSNKLIKIVQDISDLNWKYNPDKDYTHKIIDSEYMNFFTSWYAPKTLNELCYLKKCYKNTDNMVSKAAFYIVISNILMKCSSQNNGWGFIADSVKPKQLKEKNTLRIFNSNIDSLIRDIQTLKEQISIEKIDLENTLFKSNVKDIQSIKDESVDVIITSPPYPNMIDYSLSQKLSYYFWDIPIQPDIDNEFGRRRDRNKLNSLITYENNMKDAQNVLVKSLKKNGYLCYVLPYYINDPGRANIIENIKKDFEERNLIKVYSVIRNLPTLRRVSNQKWASLDVEEIIIWKKV